MPYIELGSWLQGKFGLKVRDEVHEDGRFQVDPYTIVLVFHLRSLFQHLVPR